MRRTTSTLIAAALLAGCTGDEPKFTTLEPQIAVLPESINFGNVVVDYDETQTLQVQNVGRAELTIDDITSSGDADSPFSFHFSGPLELEPDQVLELDINFAPPTYLPYADVLVITSDDEENPTMEVPLAGEGVDGPTPDILVDRLTVDFGTVEQGDTAYELVTISNVGDADLIIGEATFDGPEQFDVLDPLGGRTLSAGSTLSTAFSYTPTAETGDNATVTLTTNDPDEASVGIVLLGNGGADYEYPQAVLDCPSDVATLVTITMDGSDSYDPNDYEPLFYTWALTAPDGSRARLSSSGDQAEVYVDIAGDYIVSLIITNSVGLDSKPATCMFTAIPADQLHVELFWSTNDNDLDLHMAQDGAALFESPDDVCFCNQEPSWGETGSADDPRLDLDDMYGYGPENINIEEPEDGTYTVRVHYYADLGGGYTTATARIYLYGLLVLETSMLMEVHDTWDVADIDWPSGTITESSAALYNTTGALCGS